MVEQPAVNRLAAGSNPAARAKYLFPIEIVGNSIVKGVFIAPFPFGFSILSILSKFFWLFVEDESC